VVGFLLCDGVRNDTYCGCNGSGWKCVLALTWRFRENRNHVAEPALVIRKLMVTIHMHGWLRYFLLAVLAWVIVDFTTTAAIGNPRAYYSKFMPALLIFYVV
jgi:hypothetical protein